MMKLSRFGHEAAAKNAAKVRGQLQDLATRKPVLYLKPGARDKFSFPASLGHAIKSDLVDNFGREECG